MTATLTRAPEPVHEHRYGETGYEVEVGPEQERLDAEAKCLAKLARSYEGDDWRTTLARRCYLMAEACGEHPLTGLRYYTAADFLGEVERAMTTFDVPVPKLGPATVEKLARHELIPNLRLRERFEALTDLTTYNLAVAPGLRDSKGRGDVSRVERMLGLATVPTGRGTKGVRLFVTYEQAVAFADVLAIDYHDLGV